MVDSIEKVGFWTNPANESGYNEVVRAWEESQRRPMSTAEYKAVLSYIEQSKAKTHYFGFAICRGCGCELGHSDMISPDGLFLFPEKYEHYIIKHQIVPPNNFIRAAMEYIS